MSIITNNPSAFFTKLSAKPGTRENFQLHADQWLDSFEKGKEIIAQQVKSVSDGNYGNIHPINYPDIITGKTITNFQPFFPSKDFVGGQVKEVSYDAVLAPHPISYPDITTGTPVGKFNFVNSPPAVGKNLNTSV
ncbi:hypothetical protein QNK12_12085 [Neobacillus cucumis]|nr:hypothetical protein QNK12_12085 [Neobacillus cucumis]